MLFCTLLILTFGETNNKLNLLPLPACFTLCSLFLTHCLEQGVTLNNEAPLLKRILSTLQNVKGKSALMWKWSCVHFGEVDILVERGDQSSPNTSIRLPFITFEYVSYALISKFLLHFVYLLLYPRQWERFVVPNNMLPITFASPQYILPSSAMDSQASENEHLNYSIHRCLSQNTFFLAVDKDNLMTEAFAQ